MAEPEAVATSPIDCQLPMTICDDSFVTGPIDNRTDNRQSNDPGATLPVLTLSGDDPSLHKTHGFRKIGRASKSSLDPI